MSTSYFVHDDNMDFLKKVKNETPEERDKAERDYYEHYKFKRKLSDDEWEDFWRDEKKRLGYKD